MTKNFHPCRMFLCALLVGWGMNILQQTGVPDAVLYGLILAGMGTAAVLLLRRNSPRNRTLLWILLGMGFGLVLILKQPYDFSFHDLDCYNPEGDGHLGFIAYIVKHLRLPLQGETEQMSIYYNPPLYHIIQALFMRLNLAVGFTEKNALENLQSVTFAFSVLCPYTAAAVCREAECGEKAESLCAAVSASCPILWILGGTLNNDVMMIALLLLSMWGLLRWRNTRRSRHILLCGASLGCAMATKLNAAIVIPAMAAVFVWDFIQEKKERRGKLFGQYAGFLAVSVPEAVAWPLYHLIICDMPLNYVRLPSPSINVSRYSLWERYGIPSLKVIKSLFFSTDRKLDHNLWMELFKTGLYDELPFFKEGTVMWYVSYFWMVFFAAILVCMLIVFIRMLLRKEITLVNRVFFAGYAATLAVYYAKFVVEYPYICSMNFRYILPLWFLGAIAFGHARETMKHGRWLCLPAAAFAIWGTLVYSMYFFGTSLF